MACNKDQCVTDRRGLLVHAGVYDNTCSSIGDQIKLVFADDALLSHSGALFSELTVRVRTLGTNSYIAVGTTNRSVRLVKGEFELYTAPVINGSTVPLMLDNLSVIGDVAGGGGVVEIHGIRIYKESS